METLAMRLKSIVEDATLLLLCMGVALIALMVLVLLIHANPVKVAQALAIGAFGRPDRVAETLVQSVPLLLTGLAVALSFKCRLFNIGAEGQFLLGAVAATAVGVLPVPLPAFVHLPLALVAGAVAGAFWSGIAGALRLWRNVPEVLTTLLLNFTAIQGVEWMVRGPLQERAHGFPQSDFIAGAAHLPHLLPPTRLHAGLPLALMLAVAVWFYFAWTREGFALRVVGAAPDAALAAGVRVRRVMWTAFLLSGALSGLAGAVQITGVTLLLANGYSQGYGYTAIAVALLANLSPLGVIPSALFFSALRVGSSAVEQVGVPAVVVQVMEAVILFALLTFGWARGRRRGQSGAEE